MTRSRLAITFRRAVTAWTVVLVLASPAALAQAHPAPGDGIFTPRISPVAPIDKTGRPITVEATGTEPSFADLMVAGKSTGDSYTISFPTSTAGGPCAYTGTGRYLIESTGTLTFQILANCGNLRRGYAYQVCRLTEDLRCGESPWWHFKDQTFRITGQGVVVNGATVAWRDPGEAPRQLEAVSAKLTAMSGSSRNNPNVVHMRVISCREFHPEIRNYATHELPTACAVKSLCDGMPNVDSLRDGDPIDWNSAVGNYVKQKNKISDVSNWACWVRSQ